MMLPAMFRRLAANAATWLCLGLCCSHSLHAQTRPLIVSPIDVSKQVALTGSTHPLPKTARDLGTADPSMAAGRMIVLLKRSPEQEADLQSFLEDAHSLGSAHYHQWLAAGTFGDRFGMADSDVKQVAGWLQSQGLTVSKVLSGKTGLEFTGTVGQVSQALGTSIHQYQIGSERHYANATAPSIPEALAPAIGGIFGLDDFHPKAQNQLLGQAIYDPKTHAGKAQWTYAGSPLFYFLTPEDFATQYDVKPAYAAGINGTGQTIGIINDSNIDISLVNAYRKLFGLPVNPPQVIIDGSDPGVNGDAVEAYLDVENSGAVAPNATIKLYIAGGLNMLGVDGLNFALARAVEDDAASTLSLSFSSCEAAATAQNQYVSALWEQAAAQGQTVFVSTGDSGSTGCDGLGVNGLASTPWNVGVGGSDFYFNDYASGGASIANYWNSANDPTLGSLQKPMAEQPWNGTIYGLNSTTYDPPSGQVDNFGDANGFGGGGGGASACAVTTAVLSPYGYTTYKCVSGYPKPTWQVGTGVPQDKVRDLPDLSLFASNGYNGITWPVCAQPGDCTVTVPGGDLLVSGIGGTSASTPAMAGVMALINQKYGPQGQANFTFYPLAAQFPAVINPIDIGSNNEPCYPGDTDCVKDKTDIYYSLQHYYATPGYDQATGLGSVDVNAMLTNWNKITFKASTTTLALSATSITHGQSVTATVGVTGTGTPAGGVSLLTTSPLAAYHSLVSLDLGTTGKVSTPINYLPGGTYSVSADYSGDGINGSSKSSSTTVTVLPEASTAQLVGSYLDPLTYSVDTLATGATIAYGVGLDLDVTVVGAAAPANGSDGAATGTVTFMDGTTVLAVIPLNAGSVAEYDASYLSIGKHNITATYVGDASFKASTSSTIAFTVAQAPSDVVILDDPEHTVDPKTYAPVFIAGQSVVMNAVVQGGIAGAVPTGTMSLQYDTNPAVSIPVVPQSLGIFGYASQALFPITNLQVGNHTLTATYSGDVNFASSTEKTAFEVAAAKLAPSSTAVAMTVPAAGTSITPGTLVSLKVTVTGSTTVAPTGTVTLFIANLYQLDPAKLVPGTGNTSTATVTFVPAGLLPGNNPFTAGYSGDSVYNPSTSTTLNILDDPSDFTLVTNTANLVLPSGTTGTATLSMASVGGFNSTLALTCSAPASMTCSLNPASVALNGRATAILTVNGSVTTKSAENHSLPRPGVNGIAAGSVLACLLFFLAPVRRRLGKVLFALLFCAILSTGIGCNGKYIPSGPAAPVTTNTPSGTYAVVVTGTAPSGIVHNTTVTVVIQ